MASALAGRPGSIAAMPSASETLIASLDGTIVGNLLFDASGNVFGVADGLNGGNGSEIFEAASGTGSISVLGTFDYATTGAGLTGGLVADAAGNYYGTTFYSGANDSGYGVLYELSAGTGSLTALASSAGVAPGGPPVIDTVGDLFFVANSGTNIVELAAGSTTLTTIATGSFHATLTVDSAGNVYGTSGGGAHGRGAVFEVSAVGHTLTTLVDFDNTNGNVPEGALVMDAAGNIYGNAHNLFEIAAGTHDFSVLANFADGGTAETNQIAVDPAGDIFGTSTGAGAPLYELPAGGSSVVTLLADTNGVTNLTEDGHGDLFGTSGGSIYEFATCFCPGTLIATPRGEIAVEALRIGDLVTCVDGAKLPIRWIGRRSYAGAFIAGRHLMLPVCIKAGAIATGLPKRDLWVSPGHGIFLAGGLVPAWRLVNGVSVVQATHVENVSYLHLELEQHTILLANGLPAESFLDDGCRLQFENAAAFLERHGNSARPLPCARRLESGFALDRIVRRVATRAGIRGVAQPTQGRLRGYVDHVQSGRVGGWAQDAWHPEVPVTISVLLDGLEVAETLANAYRADVRAARYGSGCHGFAVDLPKGFCGAVEVRRSCDGAVLRPAASVVMVAA